MKTLLSAALFLVLMGLPTWVRADDQADPAKKPAIDAEKDKDIRLLLDLSGSGKIAEQMVNQMIGIFSGQNPNVPQEFWDGFRKQAKADDFIELIVPIYAAHFSGDEVKELIKFYQSPIGKKLVKEQPLMMTESMQVGQAWGARLGAKISRQLQEKGFIKS